VSTPNARIDGPGVGLWSEDGTNTSSVRRWEVKLGLGVQEWEYRPLKGISWQMRKQPIGVGSVLSEIGLLSPDGGPFRVKEKVLLKGLQRRFRATEAEAKNAVRLTLLFGSIRRAPAGWIRTSK